MKEPDLAKWRADNAEKVKCRDCGAPPQCSVAYRNPDGEGIDFFSLCMDCKDRRGINIKTYPGRPGEVQE